LRSRSARYTAMSLPPVAHSTTRHRSGVRRWGVANAPSTLIWAATRRPALGHLNEQAARVWGLAPAVITERVGRTGSRPVPWCQFADVQRIIWEVLEATGVDVGRGGASWRGCRRLPSSTIGAGRWC
jgi:hypothetical protein